MSGKGSAFMTQAYYTEEYRRNAAKIFGEKPIPVWPRDANGNLIDD